MPRYDRRFVAGHCGMAGSTIIRMLSGQVFSRRDTDTTCAQGAFVGGHGTQRAAHALDK